MAGGTGCDDDRHDAQSSTTSAKAFVRATQVARQTSRGDHGGLAQEAFVARQSLSFPLPFDVERVAKQRSPGVTRAPYPLPLACPQRPTGEASAAR